SDQKKSLETHEHLNKKEKIRNTSNLKIKMMDLNYLLSDDSIDDKKIDLLIEEITALQKTMLKNRTESMKSFRSILDKEQWIKFKNIKYSKIDDKKEKKFRKRK
ncbi:hypothetical protein ACFLR5_00875, partial [Elusimicrobiota bacterium]